MAWTIDPAGSSLDDRSGRVAEVLRDVTGRSGSVTVLAGVALAVGVWVLVVGLSDPVHGFAASSQDARSYYGLDAQDPYAGRPGWGSVGAFPYSPAFAQLVLPLGVLSWPLFVAVWSALLLASLAWLSGRKLLLLATIVSASEIFGGNIALLLAVAIVLGFRWSATWAFVLLTKVTPGIGLLWFVARREWRPLAVALGATGAIVAGSAALAPSAWQTWVEVLGASAGGSGTWAAVPIPLGARLPVAVGLVLWGARRDQRWTVPVAAMLALPALWYGSLSMMLAVIPLTSQGQRGRLSHLLARASSNPRHGLAELTRGLVGSHSRGD
jgi:hypothetical protein